MSRPQVVLGMILVGLLLVLSVVGSALRKIQDREIQTLKAEVAELKRKREIWFQTNGVLIITNNQIEINPEVWNKSRRAFEDMEKADEQLLRDLK